MFSPPIGYAKRMRTSLYQSCYLRFPSSSLTQRIYTRSENRKFSGEFCQLSGRGNVPCRPVDDDDGTKLRNHEQMVYDESQHNDLDFKLRAIGIDCYE
ncbi:unnamed protein product [Fusarium graminearum]|uniref:Uncharacterized protein n=1 Tax=Gibberella zeae TaxID=5518 RepID=A0A9N8RMZ6_GIBZA|nr:unnamed protein product [Fusarium graminearum]